MRKQSLGIGEQRRAAAVAIDRWRRTAEVEIDSRRRERSKARRVVGETGRVAAEELNDHRRPGSGATLAGEFGTAAEKSTRRQQAARDANELADCPVIAADARQHVAQQVVDQALHRCQQQFSHCLPASVGLFYRTGCAPRARDWPHRRCSRRATRVNPNTANEND
jgi:hypothetical protein